MNTDAHKRMQTLELLKSELAKLRDLADAEQLQMVAYLIEAAIRRANFEVVPPSDNTDHAD
ncbi:MULTISPECIES: hypothetical protein [unclassified Phyllobacterium]|uniref:hypothetical protein n=1 Tax=unclassified Phyllobacterium TaxID=2638441 RepID=UPI003012BEC9